MSHLSEYECHRSWSFGLFYEDFVLSETIIKYMSLLPEASVLFNDLRSISTRHRRCFVGSCAGSHRCWRHKALSQRVSNRPFQHVQVLNCSSDHSSRRSLFSEGQQSPYTTELDSILPVLTNLKVATVSLLRTSTWQNTYVFYPCSYLSLSLSRRMDK